MAPRESDRYCVSDLLSPPTIRLTLAGGDRDSVLSELVERIPELQTQPERRQALWEALREREALHSTGIGDGLALPHARTALSGLVAKPVIVFGRHPKGISYGAIDGKPVRLFFLLVTTSVPQHLQILARISRLLHDPGLRLKLLASERGEQVIEVIREVETVM